MGLGTSDKVVCRVLGGSDKCDALALAAAYQRKYTTVLKDGIKKECSGNYKRLAVKCGYIKFYFNDSLPYHLHLLTHKY